MNIFDYWEGDLETYQFIEAMVRSGERDIVRGFAIINKYISQENAITIEYSLN